MNSYIKLPQNSPLAAYLVKDGHNVNLMFPPTAYVCWQWELDHVVNDLCLNVAYKMHASTVTVCMETQHKAIPLLTVTLLGK